MAPAPQISPRASWTVRCDCLLGDVPEALVAELYEQLFRIAADLDSVDPSSEVWSMVCAAEQHLALEGWRFAYRVPHRGVLAVIGAHRIPPITRGRAS